jgi:hypothetical protein
MTNDSSIKRRINWNHWALPLLFFLIFIIEDQAFGTFFSSWLFSSLLIFFGLLYSFRYKLYQPAVIGCLAGLTLLHYILAAHFDTCLTMLQFIGFDMFINPANNPFSMGIWMINLVVLLITLPIFGPAITKSFMLEQSAKRIFNTAAQTVISDGDGFTSRPYVAGNAQYSKEQITGFTQYLSGQMIVYPVFSDAGVFLTFSMGRSPLAMRETNKISYVSFDNGGNIIVHITKKDYKRFRKQLTFNRLCESLGDVFKRFLNYYVNSQEARILTELKSF